ncbi:MAG: SIS domain-containing protein [Bdellovibrionales bacterium]
MSHIEEARRVLKIESESLMKLAEKLDDRFAKAVEMILACTGKVIVTGIGKSGHVGRKISSTLSSTGTPSVFVHPAESSHGDLGVIAKNDLVVAISYGGETAELGPLLQYVARKNIPLIALTGNSKSSLARAAMVSLDLIITEEACPMGLAPTSSSTVTLALGDALAMAALKQRGFRKEDYAEFHPGGSLGRRLTTRVRDVMHVGEALPVVRPDEPIVKVVSIMTAKEVRGVAGVVDDKGGLIGVVTDGDIRRRLEKSQAPFTEAAKDLMSKAPKTIDCEELAEKALFLMQQFQIQILFAVDRTAANPLQPVGVLHLQDLLKANIR